MAQILLIDDEPHLSNIVSMFLTERGHSVNVAGSGPTALDIARRVPHDVALIDMTLPGMSGMETFQALRKHDASLTGIFITAYGSIPSAIDAMRAGAFDYLTKPFDNEHLLMTIDRALELRQLSQEVGRLKEELHGRLEFPGIVGNSPAIQEVLRVLPRVARTDATVLLLGESGTGKELIARSIHRHSRRASKPFVAVNSSAIPSGLVETEFFGHERGAFTDAKDQRVGRFEQADGGSLFLDEVGDLPPDAQAKLLRVLEDHEVTRVGGRRPVPVDVRMIAATNRNLDDAVSQGRFRDDLFWRLNVVPLRLPALRDRMSDLPLLVDYVIDRVGRELGSSVTGVSSDTLQVLMRHDWPGNIREFENVLRRAMILAEGDVVQIGDLPSPLGRSSMPMDPMTMADAVARTTARLERSMIEAALLAHRGSRTATAEALGINRKTLFNKMRQYGFTEQTQDEDSQ